MRRRASPRFRAPHTNGTLVIVLPDVILFVRGRKHFALVDEVDFQRLQHFCFREVADAHFGHHRNGDSGHDFANDP